MIEVTTKVFCNLCLSPAPGVVDHRARPQMAEELARNTGWISPRKISLGGGHICPSCIELGANL